MYNLKKTYTDVPELNDRIDERGLKRVFLANLLGITETSLSRKLKGQYEFTRNEIGYLIQILGFDKDDLVNIFFKTEVS